MLNSINTCCSLHLSLPLLSSPSSPPSSPPLPSPVSVEFRPLCWHHRRQTKTLCLLCWVSRYYYYIIIMLSQFCLFTDDKLVHLDPHYCQTATEPPEDPSHNDFDIKVLYTVNPSHPLKTPPFSPVLSL